MSVTVASGYTWRNRASTWAQLIYTTRGVMTVHTDAGLWVVPPHQAIWVPAHVKHSIDMAGRVAVRAVYLSAAIRRRLPATCRVVDVSPLLLELLRRTMQLQTLDRSNPHERHLIDVLLDQLEELPLGPIALPTPRDPRGARAAALVRATPDARHTLADVAREVGASARTLERVFRTETGFPFGAWRQRARHIHALQLMADGANVTAAAIGAGYDSTSAFVAAFRRALGRTPGQYFKATPAGGDVEGIGVISSRALVATIGVGRYRPSSTSELRHADPSVVRTRGSYPVAHRPRRRGRAGRRGVRDVQQRRVTAADGDDER